MFYLTILHIKLYSIRSRFSLLLIFITFFQEIFCIIIYDFESAVTNLIPYRLPHHVPNYYSHAFSIFVTLENGYILSKKTFTLKI